MSTFTAVENISRRDALKMFGAVGGGLVLGTTGMSWSPMLMAQEKEVALNLFVAIGEDNNVYLTCHRSEMGQGIRTGIPQVLADELDADWDNIVVVQALADERLGSQNTDGSRSIRKHYQTMRQMGAMARTLLEQAAALQWKVPVTDVYAKAHRVYHLNSSRQLSYGDLAVAASELPVPEPNKIKLKSSSEFIHIGQSRPIVDMQAMLTGRAQYGYDIRVEGMLYASILRPPVLGCVLKTLDDVKARKIAGVIDIIRLPELKGAPKFQPLGGVAVIATNLWSALQARKVLEVSWTQVSNSGYNSRSDTEVLVERVQKPGKVVRQRGDEVPDWSQVEKLSAIYTVPYLAQAPMEPPVATAQVTSNGCEIWASTQTPQSIQKNVAAALGLKDEQVKVNVTLLGGGFGRKSKPDFSVEAAILAKAIERPVKVCWSREDDIQHGYYHATSAQFYQAQLDETKKPVALLARTGFPSISSTFAEGIEYPSAGELDLGFVDVPFALKKMRYEAVKAPSHTRIGWMRSVCNIQHGFGIGSFVDELAQNAEVTCFDMWRLLLGPERKETFTDQNFKYSNYGETLASYPVDINRYLSVIEAVEKAVQSSPKVGENQAWGFAVHRSFVSYVAVATLVEMPQSQSVRVIKTITAMDAGTLVNPDRVKSQMEGAVIFGLSLALTGEISFKEGKVQESNFHDYPVLRMLQCPSIEVILLPSNEAPAGVGEPGVPPIAPSVTNAIFAVSGKRIRALPISQHLQV
ncbi:xanthine dehydrogenase family protein molybdopterin-binding subunit [Shewanella surugensis]|uniref:Molybdopterin-dependent oxidoreductase n=1 Tax=Shewanella surugensis TaxID=212020 RepID=A0ABT0LH64_9GAMM|nr:molybdopterin cofactor-binding domain-containing protein [Shewanella surugensis]MCL1126795.1 molybdopterin-dependent oxidoreductase [Shewanella surugensis]